MSYKLFLDDERTPETTYHYMGLPIFKELDWIIVRDYNEFISSIEKNGIPDIIAFDHDLADGFEIWGDIIGYEGIYVVSNLGQVRRIKKSKGTSGENLLKPIKNESGLYVNLRNNGDDKLCKIHRLVGETFIPNPKSKPEINHKDGNRWNNKDTNLEWATSSENNLHAHNELERKFTAYAENHTNSITVSQYTKNNVLIDVYGSVNEAGRQLKISFSNIAKCACNERKTAGGFIWRYDNKEQTIKSIIKHISIKNKNYSDRFFIPPIIIEKTGYHCAKWLINYCMDNNLELPNEIIIHSMNPYGSENIKSLFNTYFKVYNIEHSSIKLNPYFKQ